MIAHTKKKKKKIFIDSLTLVKTILKISHVFDISKGWSSSMKLGNFFSHFRQDVWPFGDYEKEFGQQTSRRIPACKQYIYRFAAQSVRIVCLLNQLIEENKTALEVFLRKRTFLPGTLFVKSFLDIFVSKVINELYAFVVVRFRNSGVQLHKATWSVANLINADCPCFVERYLIRGVTC